MEVEKIFRVGIDNWYLKNIRLEYPTSLKKIEFLSDESLREGFEIKETGFILNSYTKLTESGELLPTVTILTFNPNIILEGNNIYNSREGRTIEALELISKDLESKGIKLIYDDAKVETAEIQINFNKKFEELELITDLIFSVFSNFKSKKTYGDSKDKHKVDNRPSESFWYKEWKNKYRGYDKKTELKEKKNIEIDLDITRFEYRPSAYKVKKAYEEKGLNNDLMTVLNNLEVLDDLFNKFWINALSKTFRYLEGVYFKNLEREYLKFKDIQKSARKAGKKVPRGIYKWLKENYIVYDKHYLLEIIKKYSLHPKRESEKVIKIFTNNALENIEFLSDFFPPLNPIKGGKNE